MTDSGTKIPILLETAELRSAKEVNASARAILGYVSARYETDEDLTLTIYFQRNDSAQWEASNTIILSKNKKRLRRTKLQLGLNVIDATLKLEGDVKSLILYSLKLFIKNRPLGKYA